MTTSGPNRCEHPAAAVTPVHVSISGLPAAGLVIVQARTLDGKGRPWESAAVFRASAGGTLNLATSVPVSGSYHTRRRRRTAVVTAPGVHDQPGHHVRHVRGGLHRQASGADRRAGPGSSDPAAAAAGHGKHPDGTRGRLRRDAVHVGRGQARRSRCRRARRIPCHGRHARRIRRRR